MSRSSTISRRKLLQAGLGVAVGSATTILTACVDSEGFFDAHDLPIGIQLYMLGDAAEKDLEGTLAQLSAIGFRSIELPGIRAGEAAKTRAAADKAGLAIGSVHLGANAFMSRGMLTVQDDPGEIAAELATLGCRDVVVPFPLLPEVRLEQGDDFMSALRRAFRTSTDHWSRTAALLNDRGAALRREGFFLGYHNHDIEFIPVLGTRGWDILIADTDPEIVTFELDIAWLVAGGEDPVSFVRNLAGRVRQLHVKDLHAPTESRDTLQIDSTEVGNGIIDWPRLLRAAYRSGVRQYFVEQEPPYETDRFEAAAKSLAYLSRL